MSGGEPSTPRRIEPANLAVPVEARHSGEPQFRREARSPSEHPDSIRVSRNARALDRAGETQRPEQMEQN